MARPFGILLVEFCDVMMRSLWLTIHLKKLT